MNNRIVARQGTPLEETPQQKPPLIRGEFGALTGDGTIGKGSTFASDIDTGPLIVLLGNVDDDTVGIFHFESD